MREAGTISRPLFVASRRTGAASTARASPLPDGRELPNWPRLESRQSGKNIRVRIAFFPVLFQELRQPRLRDAEMRCLERPPNLFAVGVSSGIIAARTLMPYQIRQPSFLPRLLFCPVSQLHRRTCNKTFWTRIVFHR